MIDCSTRGDVQRLYHDMAAPLLYKIKLMVKRDDIANELVQEVFLKIWQKAPKFEHEKAAFSWLYLAAHNQAIDYLRRHATRYEQTDETIREYNSGKDQNEDLSNRDLVRAVLVHLNKKEAQIFAYTALDGMNQDEIAEIMRCSRKTISRTIMRVRKTLKQKLGVIYDAS